MSDIPREDKRPQEGAPPDHSEWPVWAMESVTLTEPDPLWLVQGEQLRQELASLLLPFGIAEIEHIGSTSVPGLPAKPILDLMAAVRGWEDIPDIARVLAPHHWHFVPPELDERPWRRFFVQAPQERRTAHLHLLLEDDPHGDDLIRFRNRLRSDPALRDAYARLKQQLAAQFREDREAYTAAKSGFIRSALET
ncbi:MULTISPECIES: GrpB family protein [Paenibacillus]|uniref:GrpB family protein n=1 Tax=Paenibacillus TaxID=44249 RepID=UPI0022B8F82E|nr:GrpB family protein [Paenibacillus caseinilyticus]MCZ8518973.1 GrpB family protein [Paenibacillus caseinilyticus]